VADFTYRSTQLPPTPTPTPQHISSSSSSSSTINNKKDEQQRDEKATKTRGFWICGHTAAFVLFSLPLSASEL
jgi:hypothetical protein